MACLRSENRASCDDSGSGRNAHIETDFVQKILANADLRGWENGLIARKIEGRGRDCGGRGVGILNTARKCGRY